MPTKTPKPEQRGAPANPAPTPSKLDALVALLSRPQGARLDEMMTATNWQAHSVRGAMAGTLKKKRSLTIISEKTDAGRVYPIQDGAGA